jgi:hypothetical protein
MINPTYWHRQGHEPLYPDILWSKPENKQHAGKLLIIGGHAHGFAAPAQSYQYAIDSGAGSVRVLIPDHIRKQLSHFQGPSLEIEYAPSTPSGSFASGSLAEMLEHSNWADAVLLAGDLGRNSETAIVLEKLLSKTSVPLTATKDAVDYFTAAPQAILKRPSTCFVLSVAQLQKLVQNARYTKAVTYSMDLMHIVDLLHDFTYIHELSVVVKHHSTIIVAVNGEVSTTTSGSDMEEPWRVATASRVAVWWMQNPNKTFQAITSAVLE